MKTLILSVTLLIIFFNACKTDAVHNLNMQASVDKQDELTENPLLQNVITASIDPGEGTMQTLYGNKVAWDYVNKHADAKYPTGAVLYSVTWKQKPDSFWFGANIPKEIQSIEQIRFLTDGQLRYELCQGRPLKKISGKPNADRVLFILSQKMAVSP